MRSPAPRREPSGPLGGRGLLEREEGRRGLRLPGEGGLRSGAEVWVAGGFSDRAESCPAPPARGGDSPNPLQASVPLLVTVYCGEGAQRCGNGRVQGNLTGYLRPVTGPT